MIVQADDFPIDSAVGYFDDPMERARSKIARLGLRTIRNSGRTWDRTRDLSRVKRALSR